MDWAGVGDGALGPTGGYVPRCGPNVAGGIQWDPFHNWRNWKVPMSSPQKVAQLWFLTGNISAASPVTKNVFSVIPHRPNFSKSAAARRMSLRCAQALFLE